MYERPKSHQNYLPGNAFDEVMDYLSGVTWIERNL